MGKDSGRAGLPARCQRAETTLRGSGRLGASCHAWSHGAPSQQAKSIRSFAGNEANRLTPPICPVLTPKATFATGGFPASETARTLGYCDVKLGVNPRHELARVKNLSRGCPEGP